MVRGALLAYSLALYVHEGIACALAGFGFERQQGSTLSVMPAGCLAMGILSYFFPHGKW